MNKILSIIILCITMFSCDTESFPDGKVVLVNGGEPQGYTSIQKIESLFINSDEALSHQKLIQLDSNQKSVMVYQEDRPSRGCRYEFSYLRKKGDYSSIAIASGSPDFVKYYSHVVPCEFDQWEKVTGFFYSPILNDLKKIQFQIKWNSGEEVLLDEIKFSKTKNFDLISNKEALKIFIKPKQLAQLHKKAKEAIAEKLITTEKDSWVKGKLVQGEDKFEIKIRLKGDWTDHLSGNKWSYRIKILNNEKWRGMSSFSLQAPHTRSYSNEWLLHEFMKKEGVLTTNYSFSFLELNKESLGTYIVEEHFSDSYVSSRNLEGFIFKFSDDHLWEMRKKSVKVKNPYYRKIAFEASPVHTHNKKAKLKFPNKYQLACERVESFKMDYSLKNINHDKFAKYLAINDLFGSHHSLIWHNIKLFYNSKSHRIEPISYDGYTDKGVMMMDADSIIGLDDDSETWINSKAIFLFKNLLNDSIFFNAYVSHLKRYLKEDNLDLFLASKESEINRQSAMFKKESVMDFHTSLFVKDHSELIRKKLNDKIHQTKYVDNSMCNPEGIQNKEVILSFFVQTKMKGDSIEVQNFNPQEINFNELDFPDMVSVKKGFEVIPGYNASNLKTTLPLD